MKREQLHIVLAAALATAIALSGCSTHSSYYDKDGPPSELSVTTQSATPRVEPFRAATNRPYTVLGARYVPMTTDLPLRQRGTASWYGKQFHGKKTSTGEIYDMYAATAAHPTMPLPSYARVKNLENGKSIIVRVNDRGPFLHGRIIDLSYAAAKTLGYSSAGTATVEVTRLTWDEIRSGSWKTGTTEASMPITTPTWPMPANNAGITLASSGWGVQIGSFTQETNARTFAAHAQAVLAANSTSASNNTVRIVQDDGLWRVIVGAKLSREVAGQNANLISKQLGVSTFCIQK